MYILDDQETTAAEAIAADRTIRVLAAQPLMLSTFTSDALLDATTDVAKAQKLRHPDGFITSDRNNFQETGSVATEAVPLQTGKFKNLLVDSQHQFFRPAGLERCDEVTLFNVKTKKGGAPEWFIGRSRAAGIHDGIITEVSGDSITVTIDTTGGAETFNIADVAKFFVNGREQNGADNFAAGMPITIYRALPQRVDVWSFAPHPDFDSDKNKKFFSHLEHSVYDQNGKRHILKEGGLPKRMQSKK